MRNMMIFKKYLRHAMMKKMALVLFICMTIISSCDEPLEEEVYSFISTSNFYQTAEDANAAILGAYESFLGQAYFNRRFWEMLELPSDQVTIHRNPVFMALDDWNLTADHEFVNDFWRIMYQQINRCNVVIERVADIEMDAQRKASIIAEAHFLRAYNYFNLVRMWGEVPVSTIEINSVEGTNNPKSSVDAVYALILEDLTLAGNDLPASRSGNEVGRVTSGAAKTLMAWVYLTREQWQEAADMAQEVMNSGDYQLLDDFKAVFDVNNENNEEIIFSIQFDGVTRGNWIASFAHTGGTANPNCFNGVQVHQVEEVSDMWLNWSEADPRRNFTVYDEFISENGDTISVYDLPRPYPAFGKFNAPNETALANCPINPIVLRYPDVLLMYAEAASQANGGPTAEAYEAINQVRRRGYGQPVTQPSAYDLPAGMSQQEFRDAVLEERSLEFVMEGKRLFDLMRTNQFPEIIQAQGKPATAGKLFPIPQAELNANEALSNQDQNPGY